MNEIDKDRGGWTLFVAARYFRSKRRDKNFASSILSVVGIAVGVMTLITVIAVMNGFQIGFIEDILEISSFHIRVSVEDERDYPVLMDDIGNVKGIRSVLPMLETQTMVKTDFSNFQPCLIRGVPGDFGRYDPRMVKQLTIVEGEKKNIGEGEILIGIELARQLGTAIGDYIQILSLAGENFRSIKPEQEQYRVIAFFKSGYYEFDKGQAFINLASAERIASNNDDLVIGIKLENRFKDRMAVQRIGELENMPRDTEIVSWREYNSSFFGALKTEKIAMMVLIGLIFIVVGGNIYQSLKRTVLEKTEEISVLKSIGATGEKIRRIFIYDGIIIGLLGATAGMLAGFLITFNINSIFSIFEAISNALLYVVQQLINPILGAGMEEISVFSPRYYYMAEVPVEIPYLESVFIFSFAFLSASTAAFFASKKISDIKPSEVLRYE